MKRNIETAIFLFFVLISILCIYLSFKIPAIQLIRSEYVFEYGVDEIPTEVENYAYANDTVLEHAILDFSQVQDKVGEYTAKVIYQEQDYEFKVMIEDTTNPVVSLKGVEFNFTPGSTIKAEDLIDNIQDASLTNAYFVLDNGELVSEMHYESIGTYVQKVLVEDEQGNRSATYRVKIVIGYYVKRPTIEGAEDITIPLDKPFDARKGVTAFDGNGSDITDQIRLLKNDVDVSKPGIYEVIYYVMDQNNSSRQVSRRVIVE